LLVLFTLLPLVVAVLPLPLMELVPTVASAYFQVLLLLVVVAADLMNLLVMVFPVEMVALGVVERQAILLLEQEVLETRQAQPQAKATMVVQVT
jgi:hypothetical protein